MVNFAACTHLPHETTRRMHIMHFWHDSGFLSNAYESRLVEYHKQVVCLDALGNSTDIADANEYESTTNSEPYLARWASGLAQH